MSSSSLLPSKNLAMDSFLRETELANGGGSRVAGRWSALDREGRSHREGP